MQLWFAIDNRTSECGLVAAASALALWENDAPLRIVVSYEKGKNPPADFWRSKLNRHGKRFELLQLPVDMEAFRCCKGVFDSLAAYIRLLIPALTDEKFVIYSDADVVFLTEPEKILSEFRSTRDPAEIIGLVPFSLCKNQPGGEQELLYKAGKYPHSTYFYSGVAVIDADAYRAAGVLQKVLALAASSGADLTYHDQTMWNCVLLDEQIATLGAKWVQPAWPGRTPEPCDYHEGILHFAGSPKPWDLLGEFFHPYYPWYRDAARAAGYRCPGARKYFDPLAWQRALRIKNQYKSWFLHS